MTREDFAHVVRAAGAVLNSDEILVIGSQALHASVDGELPDEALRSIEADVSAMEDVDGSKADRRLILAKLDAWDPDGAGASS